MPSPSRDGTANRWIPVPLQRTPRFAGAHHEARRRAVPARLAPRALADGHPGHRHAVHRGRHGVDGVGAADLAHRPAQAARYPDPLSGRSSGVPAAHRPYAAVARRSADLAEGRSLRLAPRALRPDVRAAAGWLDNALGRRISDHIVRHRPSAAAWPGRSDVVLVSTPGAHPARLSALPDDPGAYGRCPVPCLDTPRRRIPKHGALALD